MNLRLMKKHFGFDDIFEKYLDLSASVWCCPIDELDHPDITHESTITEVERQIKAEVESKAEIERLKKELEEVKYLHQVQMENARTERQEKEEALKEIESFRNSIWQWRGSTMSTEKPREMFGTCGWAGTYQGLPAIVLAYYGGAQLWVCDSGQWKSVAKGTRENSVIPHTCEHCGTQLPITNTQ